MTILFFILLFFAPWAINPVSRDWSRGPQEYFCEMAIVVMVLWCVARAKVSLSGLNLPLASLLLWLMIGLYISGFMVVPFAPHVIDPTKVVNRDIINWEFFINTNAVNVVLFAFLYCIIQTEINPLIAHKAIIITTFILAVFGILQYFNMCSVTGAPNHVWRSSGLFGNPNNYNEHLAIALPYFLFMKHRLKWACIALGIIAISCARFWTSYSLGMGLVALPLAGIFYLAATKSRWLRHYIAAIALAAVLLQPFYMEPALHSAKMRKEFIDLTINKYKDITVNRNVGWGFGMYKQIASKVPYSEGVLITPHNDYLQAFVEMGRIGFALLLIVFIDLIRKVWKNRKNKTVIIYATSLLIAAQISVVSFPCHIASTMLYIFVGYALLQRECRNAAIKVCI